MPIFEYLCPKCKKEVEALSIRARKVYCVCGEEMKLRFPKPAFIDAEQFRSKNKQVR